MKVHVVLGCGELFFSKGQLNAFLASVSRDFYQSANHEVSLTDVSKPYDLKEEANRYLESDLVVFHFPIYWFGVPYLLKEYMDKVFTASYGMFLAKPSSPELYGTTGKMKGKKYASVVTCHFQSVVFEKGRFLGGMDMDVLLSSFDASMRYIGMERYFGKVFHNVIEGDTSRIGDEYESFLKNLKEFK